MRKMIQDKRLILETDLPKIGKIGIVHESKTKLRLNSTEKTDKLPVWKMRWKLFMYTTTVLLISFVILGVKVILYKRLTNYKFKNNNARNRDPNPKVENQKIAA